MSKQVLRSFSFFSFFFPHWLFLWRCFIRTVMGMSGRETLTISKSKAKRHTMPRCRNRWWPQKKRHFGWGIVCILGQLSVFVLIVAFVKRYPSNLLSCFFHLPIYQAENDLLLSDYIAYVQRKTLHWTPQMHFQCRCVLSRWLLPSSVSMEAVVSNSICLRYSLNLSSSRLWPSLSAFRGGTEAIGLLRTNPTMHRPQGKFVKQSFVPQQSSDAYAYF